MFKKKLKDREYSTLSSNDRAYCSDMGDRLQEIGEIMYTFPKIDATNTDSVERVLTDLQKKVDEAIIREAGFKITPAVAHFRVDYRKGLREISSTIRHIRDGNSAKATTSLKNVDDAVERLNNFKESYPDGQVKDGAYRVSR
jgi:hypothetical protein